MRRFSGEAAVRLAKEQSVGRRSWDLEISHLLSHQLAAAKPDGAVIERALHILCAIAPTIRLISILRSTMTNCERRIRAKCASLISGRSDRAQIWQRLATDEDARLRANALEALWGCDSPEVESLLVEALSDPHHRVAVNAAYGLYLISPEKHLSRIGGFVEHSQPRYRRAAAWLIGRTGDPDNIALLKPLLVDRNPKVRGAAFRSLALLRSAQLAAMGRSAA
ncbi:MAG TPA: HEAT repeat domain-containing protein [Bryobacteraceae bacterium]|nr:HEAT repeat domain-containing protein [Bryobacteraceae bacterium]